MAEEFEATEEQGSQASATAGTAEGPGRDLVLELNFVPAWARHPPSSQQFTVREEDEGHRREGGRREGRDDRDGRDRRPRRPREAGARDPRGGPRREKSGREEPGPRRERMPVREETGDRPGLPERKPLPNLHVRFMPDDRQISVLVRRIQGTKRAYPFAELLSLFLAHPDSCTVRIEAAPGAAEKSLFQCRACGSVALDKPALVAHLVEKHLEDYFDSETATLEAPAGNFVCVARCGLTGILLGPPNHNSYVERMMEVHRTRFPNMPFDQYKRRIETLRDPELIEKWKEEIRTQTMYLLKPAPGTEAPGTEAPAEREKMRRGDATEYFVRHIAPALIGETARATLPASVARRIRDPQMADLLARAWRYESRSPRSLVYALRGALRGRRLHSFSAGGNNEFVTSIAPLALDPARVVESIRDVLVYLREHPGCTRQALLEGLRPGTQPDDPEAARILSPLSWLIEKGHIIEFFNGTLAVPL